VIHPDRQPPQFAAARLLGAADYLEPSHAEKPAAAMWEREEIL